MQAALLIYQCRWEQNAVTVCVFESVVRSAAKNDKGSEVESKLICVCSQSNGRMKIRPFCFFHAAAKQAGW